MTWKIPRKWRAVAVTAAPLAVMVSPLAAQAREPVESTREIRMRTFGDAPGFTGGLFAPWKASPVQSMNVGPQGTSAGMPVRRVTPDEDRMRQLTGEVVKLNGMVLYVQNGQGVVVPLDVSALQLRERPEKGQLVVAVYQVENRVENVALSLAGEVKDKG